MLLRELALVQLLVTARTQVGRIGLAVHDRGLSLTVLTEDALAGPLLHLRVILKGRHVHWQDLARILDGVLQAVVTAVDDEAVVAVGQTVCLCILFGRIVGPANGDLAEQEALADLPLANLLLSVDPADMKLCTRGDVQTATQHLILGLLQIGNVYPGVNGEDGLAALVELEGELRVRNLPGRTDLCSGGLQTEAQKVLYVGKVGTVRG